MSILNSESRAAASLDLHRDTSSVSENNVTGFYNDDTGVPRAVHSSRVL